MGARDLVADSDANLWGLWRHMGQRAPRGSVEEDADVLAVATGCQVATFNPVFVRQVRPDVDAEALVRKAIDREVPVVVTANPSIEGIDRLLRAARRTGLVDGRPLPGMALPLDGTVTDRAPATPETLRIVPVGDDRGWRQYFDVLCRAFDVPFEVIEPIAVPAIFDDERMTALLGCIGGEPVASSLGFVERGVVGVYNVGTLAPHRGKGIGAAMTRAAVAWGKARGAESAVLQASEMGRRVYERMGFAEVVPYVQLVSPH